MSEASDPAGAAAMLQHIADSCVDGLPLPPRGDEQVFIEPWQAQVFAMTVALHESGVFDWSQWAQALGARVATSTDPSGADYYQRWAEALVDILEGTGVLAASEVSELEQAWHAAARRTPHGQPITL